MTTSLIESRGSRMRGVKAGAVYFALVLGVDCAIGPGRLFLTRALGFRMVALLTVPLVVVILYGAARWTIRRLRPTPTLSERLGIGLVPVVLVPIVELVLRAWLDGLAVDAYLASADPITRTLYLAMLAACGVIPVTMGRPPGAGRPGERPPEASRAASGGLARLGSHVLLLVLAAVAGSAHAWLFDPYSLTPMTAVAVGAGSVSGLTLLVMLVRSHSLMRLLYVAGALVMLASAFLLPFWRGVRYHTYTSADGQVFHQPSNLLVDRLKAPLWNPPRVSDGRQPFRTATVRWPLQTPGDGDHVQLEVAPSAAHATLGLVALGLVAGWWYRPRALMRPDPTLHVALSVSVTLLVAWLCLLVLFVVSFGFVLDSQETILAVLGGGAASGIAWGLWDARRLRRSSTGRAASPAVPSPAGRPLEGSAVCDRAKVRGHAPPATNLGAGLFGFLAGLLLAFVLAAAWAAGAVWIYSQLASAEAATRDAAVASRFVAGTAMVLAATGWASAAWLWRHRRRALAAGVAVGSTTLAAWIMTLEPLSRALRP